MDIEKKMFLFDLSSLKTDNVAEVYTRKFLLWRYKNSDVVTLDGKPIEPGIERYLMRLPNENGESNLKGEGMVSDTKDGLPLKEIHFIEQEIRKYKPLFEKSIGSELNQTPHAKLEIYLDYLNNRKTQLESQTQPEEKPQYIINEDTIETLRTILLNHAWPKEPKTELESIDVWKTRFINSEDKIDPFFLKKLPTGKKGSQFTDTRIFIKAMLDVILEKAENRPTNKDNYSKAKWGITLSKASKGKKYNDFKARIEAICGNTTLTK